MRAHEAIERVRYAHQLGAVERFEDAMPRELLERKVRDTLRMSAALDEIWDRPVTAVQLRQELRRVVAETQMPDRLQELFAALDHDPLLIHECLVRPALVSRLTRSAYALDDRIHGERRDLARALRAQVAAGEAVVLPAGVETIEEVPPLGSIGRIRSAGTVTGVIERRHAFVFHAERPEGEGQVRKTAYRVAKRSWSDWWEEVSPSLDTAAVTVPRGLESLPPLDGTEGAACDARWDNGRLEDGPGDLMLVWGGFSFEPLGSFHDDIGQYNGVRYDPVLDQWSSINPDGAPRRPGPVVWTGSEMFLWTGSVPAYPGAGGRYDPVTDSWTPVSGVGAPSGRTRHTLVWTGSQVILWGGQDEGAGLNGRGDGGLYDPVPRARVLTLSLDGEDDPRPAEAVATVEMPFDHLQPGESWTVPLSAFRWNREPWDDPGTAHLEFRVEPPAGTSMDLGWSAMQSQPFVYHGCCDSWVADVTSDAARIVAESMLTDGQRARFTAQVLHEAEVQLEAIGREHGEYPTQLQTTTSTDPSSPLGRDGWGHPLGYWSGGLYYVVASPGSDGAWDYDYDALVRGLSVDDLVEVICHGAQQQYEQDLIVTDVGLCSWPAQPE